MSNNNTEPHNLIPPKQQQKPLNQFNKTQMRGSKRQRDEVEEEFLGNEEQPTKKAATELAFTKPAFQATGPKNNEIPIPRIPGKIHPNEAIHVLDNCISFIQASGGNAWHVVKIRLTWIKEREKMTVQDLNNHMNTENQQLDRMY